MEYLTVKWLHVVSSTILFGTGIGSAYYMLLASLGRKPEVAASVVRQVVRADWLFTTTTIVIQPLTGWYMAKLAHLPLSTPWIAWSFALYFLAGACWLPVVWIQIRMRRLAESAVQSGKPLPPNAAIAVQQAAALADILVARLEGRSPVPFQYQHVGELVSLGRHEALAEVKGIRLTGFPAWWIRRTYYLFQMPRWDRRLRIVLDWTIALFFRPDITKVELQVERELVRGSEQ